MKIRTRPLAFLVAAASAMPAAAATDHTLNLTTEKSVSSFTQCFLAAQQGAKNDWWIVPHPRGGVISNDGGKAVSNAYTLELVDAGSARTIKVIPADPQAAPEPPVAAAIASCTR